MEQILLSPPIAFLIFLALATILSLIGRGLAGPESPTAVKSSLYAGGEISPSVKGAPGYRPFFVYALFFAILHLGVLMLANSITTVRNPSGFGVGNGPETTLGLAARTAGGEVVGPFIYSSGQLIDGPNSFWGPQAVVETVEGVRERVRQDAEAGYMAIKLYANLSPEQFWMEESLRND